MTVPLHRRLLQQKTFAALNYPNYRLWFGGQIISLFGSWMQTTAQGFLVYELTQSAAYLGYVSFAAGIPSWLFMLWAGVIADRIPRRNLLIITQTSMMLLAFGLSFLSFAGLVNPVHIIIFAGLLGIANAFDAPARLALAPELVDHEDLTNAIALNGSMFNLAVIVGPTVGSLVYASFGPGWCFFLNGLSFIAVIFALKRMRIVNSLDRPKVRTSAYHEVMDGMRYAIFEPTIRIVLVLVSVISLFGISYYTLMPAWAVEVLKGGVKTNGFLLSARGVGALAGALGLASLGRFKYRGKLFVTGTFIFPAMLLLFSTINWLPLSLLVLTGVGAAMVLVMNLANSIIQTTAPNEMRGRINGIYSLTFFGFSPIGSIIIGLIAEQYGAPSALKLGSAVMLATSLVVWFLVPHLRKLE